VVGRALQSYPHCEEIVLGLRPMLKSKVALAVVVTGLAGAALAALLVTRSSPDSVSPTRQEAMIETLASQGTTFSPATDADRMAQRKPAASVKPSGWRGAPPRVRRDAAVYLGRLREVRGPTLGTHGGWAVVQRGDSPFHASAPVDRLAYVVQLRDVAMCRVSISCPIVHGSSGLGKAQEYYFFIDARSGREMGGLGLPEGYDPNHPLDHRHARG
jgi:hypothetical protein